MLMPSLMNLVVCPVCKHPNRKEQFKIKKSTVFQCTSCHVKYLDPCLDPAAMKQAYESEETLAQFHDFHEGYYDYGDLKVPSKTLLDFKRGLTILESVQKNKGRILDVGFGNGFFLAAARELGWEVKGIDPSQTNIKTANQKFGLQLECAALENYDTPERFDAISFWDVLEHLPDPGQALQKAAGFLKPGGFILIGVPNDRSLLAFLTGFFYRIGFKKFVNRIYFLEHVCYYSPGTLTLLLQKNGFRLCGYFTTSTDLEKYKLSSLERVAAAVILALGRILGLQNRLCAVYQKS